jgi:hypothetical protein
MDLGKQEQKQGPPGLDAATISEINGLVADWRAEQFGPHRDALASVQVEELLTKLASTGAQVSPVAAEAFSCRPFLEALPPSVRMDAAQMYSYLEHSCRFGCIREERYLGDIRDVPQSLHEDGRVRRAESGREVLLDRIREAGISPEHVLVYRCSQPAGEPKPEYYWTTDFWEACRGLQAEISPTKRQSSVILVSTLADIATNGGLIRDINDDGGLAVRQIGLGPFAQEKCLAVFRYVRP